MYNPDQLVVTKEETRFPWEPFKSRTGDPPTSTEPSTTVVPTPQPIPPKLCPYRKQTVYMTMYHGSRVEVSISEATFSEEFFLPCMEDCMCYAKYASNGYSPTCNHK